MNQTERILAVLNAEGQLCAMEPLEWRPRIYRTAARVQDLRDRGYEIVTRRCQQHEQGSNHAVYVLADPAQLGLGV